MNPKDLKKRGSFYEHVSNNWRGPICDWDRTSGTRHSVYATIWTKGC